MSEKWFLKFKDVIIASFQIDKSRNLEYTPYHHNCREVYPWGYPLLLFPTKIEFTQEGLVFISKTDHNVQWKDFEDWILSRVFPKERGNIEDLLKKLNLERYDSWEIAKLTKCLNSDDYYWITQNPRESYEDVVNN